MTTSLPPDALEDRALEGRTLAVSVSQSPDLARLGQSEERLRLTLGEVTRVVLRAGGHLAYGGHLDPQGYTSALIDGVDRYGRGDRPLLVCLAWPEHRRLPLSELRARLDLGRAGRVVCLDPAGHETDPAAARGEAAEPTDPAVARASLTAMRRFVRDSSHGRLLVGGRRGGFQGELPGVLEEAVLALEAATPRPLYLAAGFGGVTADMVRVLGIDDCAWLPGGPERGPEDPRLRAGLERLRALGRRAVPSNGLTRDENHRLAVSRSPAEIAALVALGLGRLAG